MAPTWNDEFELPDGSYLVFDIQDYIEYIMKNMKHLLSILLFIFTSMKLFGSTKNLIDKAKNGEKVASLEVVEVVLVQ